MRSTVAVSSDQAAVRNFDLTTGLYQLDAFKVTGEREGAAAITAARNAENLKNVVATDSFGNLPNLNAAEVAIRLPCDIDNLFNESQRRYRGIPDQMQSTSLAASTVNFGVIGRF